MANDYNERRRRAGVRLTPEQEDWIARAMDAQSKGLPVPPKPTETGADGMQRLTPAYTDPRSQSIANSPIRPVRSMLDRIFSPGRADAANQMNREYKENALTSQLGRSGQRIEQDYNKARTESMLTSNKMEKLKELAMSGDADALKLLKAYTAAIGKGGGIDYGMLGGNKTVDGLVPSPKSGGDTPTPPPSGPVLSGQLTLSEAREKATSGIAELQRKLEMLDAEEADINTEGSTRSIPSYATGGSHPGAAPQPSGTRDIPINMAWRARRTKEIPAERAAMQQEIQQLEQVLTEISGPLTSTVSPDMGGATRSTVDQ